MVPVKYRIMSVCDNVYHLPFRFDQDSTANRMYDHIKMIAIIQLF